MAKQRRKKLRRVSPKVAAAIDALRASLGPFRCGKFQDLADALAANGCSIKDLQKAALIVDEHMLWEHEISEITARLIAKKVPLPDAFSLEELLTVAAASGDQEAQALLDARVPEILS